jgi:hypothetical protein
MVGAGADLACRGWGGACVLLRCPVSTAMASSSLASPVNKQGRVRSGHRDGVPCIQRRSREEEGRSTATSTPAVNLPEALRAPATVLLRLGVGCEVEKVSRSEGVEWG